MSAIVEFLVWNKQKEYQGRVTVSEGTVPMDAYYEKLPTPTCPPEPKLEDPDGWYIVNVPHGGVGGKINRFREKREFKAYNRAGDYCDDWHNYEVVAECGDVKFRKLKS